LFYIMMATTPSRAKALPGASGGPADTVRFEQSLVFTDGGSNRSEDTIRAIREGCHSDALNGAGNPVNGPGRSAVPIPAIKD
jgi:hypothetical protein